MTAGATMGTYRAAGKVILLGEHAVVYGHPALAGGLSTGVSVETSPGTGVLRVPAWAVELSPTGQDGRDERALARGYVALRRALGLSGTSPVDLTVTFGIPTGAGLGSSGALAAAVARALTAAHGLEASLELLSSAAMASETEIHGRPSGLDHTLALLGGFGLFTRSRGLEPVAAASPVRVLVGQTGRERDTHGRVARIAQLLDERGEEVRQRFSAIEALVERGRRAIERGDIRALGEAMTENQHHLEALEVSCPEIERMCELAEAAGAAGCKLTGGGGGGCVVAVAPGREDEVLGAWRAAGYEGFAATMHSGATGGGAS